MKSIRSLIEAGVIAALIAAPIAAFAQSNQANQPLSRAQVHDPSNANPMDYPANIQAGEAKVAGQNQAAQNSGYGAPSNGSSQRGGRTDFAPTSYSVPVVNYTR
ncbi:hypothetical protein [Paraburkholderia sp. BR10923]|uniref:hypothetical protein n=1 Tax=Paraburkholderia TaxID=1822464 RepID=UPI0034CDED85